MINLQELWNVEQEILDVIHQVCTENGLRYTLAYGTLIGAVRHEGFIPWDDDIDIMMPREDYEKLLVLWDKTAPKGYILQNNRTDPDFTQTFTKIRKDNTAFLHTEEERGKAYHKGIFVDIFPADRVAPKSVSRKLQYVASAVNLLYSRGYTSGTGGAIGLVEKVLLCCPEKVRIWGRKRAEKVVTHWQNHNSALYVSPCTIKSAKIYYPANLFEEYIELQFRGKTYHCAKIYDELLRADYGDYMQLPPENERVWKHHPIFIDFERNLEDICESNA